VGWLEEADKRNQRRMEADNVHKGGDWPRSEEADGPTIVREVLAVIAAFGILGLCLYWLVRFIASGF